MRTDEEAACEGETARLLQDRAALAQQSSSLWKSVFMQQDVLGILLSITMLAILWFTFRICKPCVLGVFVTSSMLCMRLPYLQIVFWPSLLILVLNVHALRGVHVKVDLPVGETIDNLWRP
jgi:hypothetical protein